MALATETVDEATRRRVVAARLDGAVWTERRIEVVVVDADTGDRRILDAASGVDLVDAVAASCAVPGVWPPVTIDGARYVDGGIWSFTSTDRAAGHGRVLVLAPLVDPALDREIAGLPGSPRVEVVRPDRASTEAFGADGSTWPSASLRPGRAWPRAGPRPTGCGVCWPTDGSGHGRSGGWPPATAWPGRRPT